MDNARLQQLLDNAGRRQFWLKPFGLGDRPIVINGVERTEFGESEVEIRFTRDADEIHDGDVLIVYRVGVAQVVYVAERLPQTEWTTGEHEYPAGMAERYSIWFKARNLTPDFGIHWSGFPIKPFTLASILNPQHPPPDQARLGTLQHGNDRARIPHWFAVEIIQRIQAATLEPNAVPQSPLQL